MASGGVDTYPARTAMRDKTCVARGSSSALRSALVSHLFMEIAARIFRGSKCGQQKVAQTALDERIVSGKGELIESERFFLECP